MNARPSTSSYTYKRATCLNHAHAKWQGAPTHVFLALFYCSPKDGHRYIQNFQKKFIDPNPLLRERAQTCERSPGYLLLQV